MEVSLHVDGLIPAVNLEADFTCTNVELGWEVAQGGSPDSWNITVMM
ncbi:MAG: hypothetical protein R2750_04130 [Bacteroidales bacterium]